MKRPVSLRFGLNMAYRTPHAPREASRSSGYTLIEILVATTLALMLLGAVVRMFAQVGEGITDSRAMLEAADRLRVVQTRLQQDLAGETVTMNPPAKPENNEGYFEYIEGPITQANASNYAVDTDNNNTPDTTVGDFDDILMFTTRSTGRPFVGKCDTTTIQSDVAEVAWFVRGRTLYRRVLLVAPTVNNQGVYTGSNNASGFYSRHDISARPDGALMVANTLGDLTRRECRFAHLAANPAPLTFPYDARLWYWQCTSGSTTLNVPTLPTLRECSSTGTVAWIVGTKVAPAPIGISPLDFWTNDSTKRFSDVGLHTNTNGARVADDVILTNVIGFDVKAWDPTQNAYMDLGYNNANYNPANLANGSGLGHVGCPKSRLQGTFVTTPAIVRTGACVYDTWSTHYEATGIGLADALAAGTGINGFDDQGQSATDLTVTTPANGIVDDADEQITSPPYPVPLRGIQVKIRIFEPDSKQIREVTVVQEFLPQ